MSADATQMLGALVAPLETGYIELRPIDRQHGAGKSEFFHITDHANAAQRASALGRTLDVYYGVIPRTHEGGRGAADVGAATTIWADLDSDSGAVELASFALEPLDRRCERNRGPSPRVLASRCATRCQGRGRAEPRPRAASRS
jgi:hypothetical protein